MLRNRLRVRKNPEYFKWTLGLNKSGLLARHHILKSVFGLKLNDLLIAMIPHKDHMEGHYPKIKGVEVPAEDFEGDLINALENIFDYCEFLQAKLKEKK